MIEHDHEELRASGEYPYRESDHLRTAMWSDSVTYKRVTSVAEDGENSTLECGHAGGLSKANPPHPGQMRYCHTCTDTKFEAMFKR